MKKGLTINTVGILYAFIHFSVEVSCFYFLFSRLSDNPLWWALALLYDALAFVPQSFFGLIADKHRKFNYGALGCILMIIGFVVPVNILALFILCIGNALVHIAGAEKTLNGANGKITPCSIYVGGGSAGVITGQLLGLLGLPLLSLIPLGLMVLSLGLTFVISALYSPQKDTKAFEITADRSTALIVIFAFIAVAIRSYIGYAIPTDWNKTKLQAILLFFFMGAGKILGGVLSDKFGYRKTTFISLICSLPFLLFGNSVMTVSLIGIGLFSMTMPITVAILVSELKDNPCFAFGITTVALFAGIVPAFFIKPEGLLFHQLTVLILSLISAVSLFICIQKGS